MQYGTAYIVWRVTNDQMLQEAQLMLTNPRDAFRGQSRSSNIVPFHMLGIVSSCAIVTLSLRRAVFPTFDFQKMSWPWNSGQTSIKVIESGTIRYIAYDFLLVFYRNFVLKTSFWDIRHQKCHDLECLRGNVTMRYSAYDFLLTFYSNYSSISCRSWYSMSKNVATLKSVSEVTQSHWKWCHSIDCVWFPVSVL